MPISLADSVFSAQSAQPINGFRFDLLGTIQPLFIVLGLPGALTRRPHGNLYCGC
jgi:hypothetical protein